MQEQDFYRADPLARWLIDKCHFKPVNLALLSIIISSGFYLFVAAITKTLILPEKGKYLGLFQDWFAWIWICLLNPVIFGYYIWSFKAIYRLIQYLEQSDIVDISKTQIKTVLLQYRKPWRKFLALAAGVSYGIWYFFVQQNVHNWTGSDGELPAITGAINGVAIFYTGTILVLTLITNVWVLHELLGNKQLKINPLHPDRCGGLSPLSQYSLNTAYLVAIFGMMITLTNYQFITEGISKRYWYFNITLLLYIPISIVCFFGPLLAARKGMKKVKEELLSEIAKHFHENYTHIQTNLNSDVEILQKETAKLQELRSLYTLTNEFPVWPFDVITFRQYLLSVITPLIPLLIKLGGYLVKMWFK